jgi:hypothetical protein
MAVLKLRKDISKHTFNDTINFWSNRPWKNPNVGKTSEREGVLISSNLEITSAKIKPTVYLSLPPFPCLKNDWKKYTHSNLEIRALTQPYCTDCFFIKCCTVHLEKRAQSLLLPYDLYGTVNVAQCLDLRAVLSV